jgi:hypothetical protein
VECPAYAHRPGTPFRDLILRACQGGAGHRFLGDLTPSADSLSNLGKSSLFLRCFKISSGYTIAGRSSLSRLTAKVDAKLAYFPLASPELSSFF